MSDFDYDKIKDMEYDQDRKCYVGKNGEENFAFYDDGYIEYID